MIRHYRGSGADEFFISFENADRSRICGFVRLRLSAGSGSGVFPELESTALVRELHVYGVMIPTSNKQHTSAQHVGFGKRMMRHAEKIAWRRGYRRMAVIAGVGTRNYYRSIGYELMGEGQFMVKTLTQSPLEWRDWRDLPRTVTVELDRSTVLKWAAGGVMAAAAAATILRWAIGGRAEQRQAAAA